MGWEIYIHILPAFHIPINKHMYATRQAKGLRCVGGESRVSKRGLDAITQFRAELS